MIQQNPKFLIIKTSALGDIIHTFPVIAYLKKKFPHCQIDWVAERFSAELLFAHPQISRVITIETKKWRSSLLKKNTWKEFFNFRRQVQAIEYDYVFDLQGNIKSGFVLSNVKAKKKIGFGQKSVAEWPNLLFTNVKMNPPLKKNIREDYLFIVESVFHDFEKLDHYPIELQTTAEEKKKVEEILFEKPSPLVLVCPGTKWQNKKLPCQTMGNILKDMKAFFLFSYGNEKEKDLSAALHSKFENSLLLPYMQLSTLQYLMSKVDLVIAMDSLPLHLAGTTNTRTLSFFGPSSPLKYLPMGENHQFIWGACPYKVHFEKRCPRLRTCQTGACIKSISEKNI